MSQVQALADEIRAALTKSVTRTGGHLASNLGTVELTLALHRVLDTPADKIIFDVGHQSYTHKLITGRQDLLETLRGEGGISGFPKRTESEYDVFETGHASTALSAAVGMARARDVQGKTHVIAAVVGDGALTGGMCYEALNDAGSRPTQLIMVLNDNEMSIARNVGALSTYLTHLRGSKRWIGAKGAVKRGLYRIPLVGPPLAGVVEKVKRTVKLMLVPGEFFEALGFGYLGPIDGHDIPTLERALRDAKAMNRPVVVHAVTQKGRGYTPAEQEPERFHGVAPFFVEHNGTQAHTENAAAVAGDTLQALAAADQRILAITAAMPQGTGLAGFAQAYPDRFFDVGIAEEHAMTMAAGMAAGGMRPVFAVYASFMQRALDQLLHDVCLQGLPVLVLMTHDGFVSGDGATHQGVYDLSALRAMPGLTIWTPCDGDELRAMLPAALRLEGPCVIRFPKVLPASLGALPSAMGSWRMLHAGEDIQLIAHGHAVETASEASTMLAAQGIRTGVWSASSIAPLDVEALDSLKSARLVAVLEESQCAGGLCEAIAGYYAQMQNAPRVLCLGIDGIAPGAHTLTSLAAECGLDAACVAAHIKEALDG